jgi:hypothetical protein
MWKKRKKRKLINYFLIFNSQYLISNNLKLKTVDWKFYFRD